MAQLNEQPEPFHSDDLGPPESFVYFIQQGDDGPVKIGVAVDPESRRRILQVGNPAELHIRHTVPGSFHLEYELHGRFGEWRVRGEWFGGGERSAVILTFAAGLHEHRDEVGSRASTLRRIRRDAEMMRERGDGPNWTARQLSELYRLPREQVAEIVRTL